MLILPHISYLMILYENSFLTSSPHLYISISPTSFIHPLNLSMIPSPISHHSLPPILLSLSISMASLLTLNRNYNAVNSIYSNSIYTTYYSLQTPTTISYSNSSLIIYSQTSAFQNTHNKIIIIM